jgi:hypothetical protein
MTEEPKPETEKTGDVAEEFKSPWSLLATALSIIPILGSVGLILALLHEIGYTSYYGLPIEFIRLDSSILQYVAPPLLLAFSFGITFIVWVLITFSSKKWYLSLLAYCNLLVTPAVLYASLRDYFGGSSSWVALALLVLQLIPMIMFGLNKERNDKLEGEIKKRSKYLLTWVFIGLLFLCGLAYSSGSTDVLFCHTYLIPSTNSDSVVLRIYGDNVVCAPLANNNTSIERKFFILDLSSQNLTLSLWKFDHGLGVEPIKAFGTN